VEAILSALHICWVHIPVQCSVECIKLVETMIFSVYKFSDVCRSEFDDMSIRPVWVSSLQILIHSKYWIIIMVVFGIQLLTLWPIFEMNLK
jgi:hypothetical protein